MKQQRVELYVMNFLGHKSVEDTVFYVQLEQAIYAEASDQFTCRIVTTAEEARDHFEAASDTYAQRLRTLCCSEKKE